MTDVQSSVSTDPYILMEIIRLQTEIAKLGLDLSGVVNAVVERIPALTNAEGAIVEYTEGDEMVYRGASGISQSAAWHTRQARRQSVRFVRARGPDPALATTFFLIRASIANHANWRASARWWWRLSNMTVRPSAL